MKKLINSLESVLDEQLQGMGEAHPELRVHQDPRFVTRAEGPVPGKVALLSGGGSGHEPMHCGFVGEGMLDGACPGEIFTSPTPDQMYQCGQAIDGGAGVLLIIKNYTGDVMNFETATELLHDSGTLVATVLVDDDVAVKDSLFTAGRRGVANTVLMEKLLGAAAVKGGDLEALVALGHKVNNQGHSIGIALGACTVPAAGRPSFTLADNEMEFGVGIHGEPGIERRPFTTLNQAVDDMFHTLIEHGSYQRTIRVWDRKLAAWRDESQSKRALARGDRVIALVNNLGATPLSELYGVYHRLAERCAEAGIIIERNLVGSYCTSLDMQGVSITLLQVDDELLSLWDAPVKTPALRWNWEEA
ncbi:MULTISPECIES: dihydroxyacetone kinase subunit DhaK [unclassified Serratia (in: enterobacteria)]|uniref:dihydroxyacetone kinase subunit DhaK n=1 Tax=unclassified Serratia (in: enterobacteria) TaxID=2647522 RepID=UPI0030765C83